MKNIAKILILLISLIFAQQTFAQNLSAKVKTHRIPEGTLLKLKTYNTVSTNDSSVGDQFDAMLVSDKLIGKDVVLPQGTLFRGRVEQITPSKRLSRSAVLYLTFENVITPMGKQIYTTCEIYGISMNPQGGITDNGTYVTALKNNWSNAKNMTVAATQWGLKFDNPSKYVLAPIGAIGGGTAGILYLAGDSVVDLFKKGTDVLIKNGSVITVILTKPLDIPLN